MFETAELGHAVPNKVFKKTVPVLREELLELQQELRTRAQSQVIVLFAGVDGAGKGETVGLLNAWLDPRWLVTRGYDGPSESARARPEFWRYWRDLPPRGRVGMFLSAWYSRPVLERVYGKVDEAGFGRRLERIVTFESALADDDALILKFWMHLSRDAQKQRFERLESDPLTRARVSERDWENWRNYDRFIEAAQQVIARTSTGKAPWTIVEGRDQNYRTLTVTAALRDAMRRRLSEPGTQEASAATAPSRKRRKPGKRAPPVEKNCQPLPVDEAVSQRTVLSELDMGLGLSKAQYRQALERAQAALHTLHLQAKDAGLPCIFVFEGPDASGKGGAIRRVYAALDPRRYQVYGFTAPSDEERAQHYLWRFWRRLPAAGQIAIMDRSWYGRVLVERVEGYASGDEWRRAYNEINDFESQLVDWGCVLVKFWLHISRDEQLARFRQREQTPYKRWKLTKEDWRNRDRWGDYEIAVDDLVQHTSTSVAPWTLVEANDKRYARVKVLDTVVDRLSTALGMCVVD